MSRTNKTISNLQKVWDKLDTAYENMESAFESLESMSNLLDNLLEEMGRFDMSAISSLKQYVEQIIENKESVNNMERTERYYRSLEIIKDGEIAVQYKKMLLGFDDELIRKILNNETIPPVSMK